MMAFARSKISWLRWIVMGSERSLEIAGAAAVVWHNHAMSTKLSLVGILVVFGFAGTAAADVDVRMTVVPGQGAPQIEAVLERAPRVPLTELRLRDPRGIAVPATEVIEFPHSTETIAIAIVVEGGEVWMGNTGLEPEDSPARYLGAFDGIQRGLDSLDLATTMPPGSLGTVITYDERARVRLPLGPIGRLNGQALGTEKDYYYKIGQSLVQATSLALGELEQAPTHKKLMIVISDGNDTNNEAAKAQFADLKKRAAQGGIQIAAVIYKGQLSEPTNAITTLHPLAVTANSFEAIEHEMREAVRRATSQYAVRFAGERLSWDGTTQELTVILGATELDPVTVQMGTAHTPAAETPWFLRWWTQLAAGVLLVGLVMIGQRLRGRSVI